jgi:hypothetical protein
MERLTEKYCLTEDHYMKCSEDCNVDMACVDCPAFDKLIERLAAYEDTGLTPEEIKAPFTEDKMINLAAQALGVEPSRIRELAEADKDGRVVILPCKVGDTVWFKTYKNNARDCIGVQPHEVTRISASIIVPGEIVDIGIPVDQIGVRVFLSETEAVAADAKPPAGNSILEV